MKEEKGGDKGNGGEDGAKETKIGGTSKKK